MHTDMSVTYFISVIMHVYIQVSILAEMVETQVLTVVEVVVVGTYTVQVVVLVVVVGTYIVQVDVVVTVIGSAG